MPGCRGLRACATLKRRWSASPSGSSTRPALCVDLDKLEQNIATMKAKLAGTGVATRPHAKTHKCPAIAKLQLAAGSIGVCTAKVSEAEALFANGVDKILMTTSNVTANKIRRAMTDSQGEPQLHPGRRLSEPMRATLNDAAKEAGVVADVVIDVAVGTRSGVPAGAQALALAQFVDKLPNLKLRGIISYDGGAQHIKGFKTRLERTLQNFEPSRADVRHVQARGPEHGDLQRRRHRHLQHHDEGARVHRPAGGQLHLHGCAVPRDRRRERRASSPTSSPR